MQFEISLLRTMSGEWRQ